MATQEVTFLTDPYTWTTLSFVLVVGFGGFKAVKGISAALDKRAQKISDELDEAQRLREEAQELLNEKKITPEEYGLMRKNILGLN